MTAGLFGAFFFYQILLILFQDDRDIEDKEYHGSDSLLIFIFSFPFLIDFCIGILGLRWAVLLIEPEGPQVEEQEIGQPDDPEQERQIEQFSKNLQKSNDLCSICLERKKDCIFYPCGHEVACFGCG